MSKKTTITTPLLYAFDAGNGTCKGISTAQRDVFTFEPVIAPLTTKKGIQDETDKPTYSLKVDDQVYVFGVDDVFAHGQRNAIRRLNSEKRYTDPDYYRLLNVMLLQAFAAYRGKSEPIRPTGVTSLPVSIYNNEKIVSEVRQTLLGKHEIVDFDGCELRLIIEDKRLLIVPESYGAMMHYAYHPDSLKRRQNTTTTGTTMVIDIGYETTDCSIFEGLKYQRDPSFTIQRAGLGIVARRVREEGLKAIAGADTSRVDRALQAIAALPLGADKVIEPIPGVRADVTDIYDQTIVDLSKRIADEIATRHAESVARVLLAGGGSFHMLALLSELMEGVELHVVPDADLANVYGAFTMLNVQASR